MDVGEGVRNNHQSLEDLMDKLQLGRQKGLVNLAGILFSDMASDTQFSNQEVYQAVWAYHHRERAKEACRVGNQEIDWFFSKMC